MCGVPRWFAVDSCELGRSDPVFIDVRSLRRTCVSNSWLSHTRIKSTGAAGGNARGVYNISRVKR